jgi:Arc/MetJ-type ribon-helix-helix transcriptional regulator
MARTLVETSSELMEQIDEMVREGYYPSRVEAVNDALELLIKSYKKAKLHAKDRRLVEGQREAGESEEP